jgi:hypothetical protein
MFLKKLDWLSPPITLYFKGEGSHVSIYSGILSLVAYIIVVVATFYYALGFINRQDPKAYFFNRYIEDAGTFPVNATQMFNFIQVSNPQTNLKVPLDFSAFRIVGFDDAYSDDYMNNPEIVRTKNHWVYGNCNNSTDTEGIGHLVTQDFYEQSACIRKYYDVEKHKYFKTGEDGFRWPVIVKGCSNPDRTYYGIIMQRCDHASEFLTESGEPACKTSSEIDNVINSVSFNFQIIDHYADMLNYEMPFTKYFYEVTSSITTGNFVIQHLNFNPANMITHNGYFFDNQVEEKAYFFTQNEKQTVSFTRAEMDEGKTINGCLIGVYFWMQNTLQYYERTYDRIQDILSDIGGISSIVLTIAGMLNLLIHNFIVILDTEDLALNTEQDNYNSREMSRRPTIFRKANEVMFPPRRPYQPRKQSYGNDPQQQQSSNYQRLMKDGVDIYPNMSSKDEKSEQYKNLYLKRGNILNNNYEGNKDPSYQQNISKGYGGRGQNYNRGMNRQGQYMENKETYSKNLKDETTTEKKDEIENRPLEKQNFNWCKFLGYLICCGRNDKKMSYYEDFRAKLISEENIIQNYLDTYKLLKHCGLKKTVFNDKVE